MTSKAKISQYRPNFKQLDTVRNRTIYSRHLGGASYSQLSKTYNVTASRIGQICQNFKNWIAAGYVEPIQINED